MMSFKIALLGNLVCSATAVCNKNPSITKTDNLKELCSTVLNEFKAKYKDTIIELLKNEELEYIYCEKIKKMFNGETAQISIDYNGDNHKVIFKYLEVDYYDLFLKIEIPSLNKSFVLKQGITPYQQRYSEEERLEMTEDYKNTLNLIHSELSEQIEMAVFGEVHSSKYEIEWEILSFLEIDFFKHFINWDPVYTFICEKYVIKMLSDIISQLVENHGNNIVHGDIKLENIRILDKYEFILQNTFGLTEFKSSMQQDDGKKKANCELDVKSGKEGFLALEVSDCRQTLDCASDIWSFGIMAFEFASCHDLDEARKMTSGFLNLTDENIDLEIEKLNCSSILKKLISGCLKINFEERVTARQLFDDPMIQSFRSWEY